MASMIAGARGGWNARNTVCVPRGRRNKVHARNNLKGREVGFEDPEALRLARTKSDEAAESGTPESYRKVSPSVNNVPATMYKYVYCGKSFGYKKVRSPSGLPYFPRFHLQLFNNDLSGRALK